MTPDKLVNLIDDDDAFPLNLLLNELIQIDYAHQFFHVGVIDVLPQVLHLHVSDLAGVLLATRQIEEATVLLKLIIEKLLMLLSVAGVLLIAWTNDIFQEQLVDLGLEYLGAF